MSDTGVAARMKGSTLVVRKIPSWSLYRRINRYRNELYLIHMTRQMFARKLKPINSDLSHDKCPVCKHYQQYYCAYHSSLTGIPAGTMKSGCEQFKQNNSVYF